MHEKPDEMRPQPCYPALMASAQAGAIGVL